MKLKSIIAVSLLTLASGIVCCACGSPSAVVEDNKPKAAAGVKHSTEHKAEGGNVAPPPTPAPPGVKTGL